MIELFHTANIKLAATLDALGFDLHSPPVTRFVKEDKSETVTFWFLAERKLDGLHAGAIFDAFVKGDPTPEQITPEDPVKFAAHLLESRNKCVELLHLTPKFKRMVINGKTVAINENASAETRAKFAEMIPNK